jgi:FMN phosphatase YigB (HAD superfamily)
MTDNNIRAIIIDLDGTLYIGDTPINLQLTEYFVETRGTRFES